jgi:hypothetical protein
MCEAGKYVGGCNGKGNRILYSAKISQVFEVFPGGPTSEATGVSGAGTQIGVTNLGYPHITYSYPPGPKADEIQGLRHRWKESSFAASNCLKPADQLDLHQITMGIQAEKCERACARNSPGDGQT